MSRMRDAIKDLSLFGFDEFRPGNGIIKDLINGMAMYRGVMDATDESFWSEVEGASEYDAALRRKAAANPGKYDGHTWRNDCIEKARGVWEYFFLAARLVAIIPVSSALVERVSSAK